MTAKNGQRSDKKTTTRAPIQRATATEPQHAAAGVAVGELASDVQRVLAELGAAAAEVVLKQWNESTHKYDYLTRIPSGLFTMEWVKQEFGGGDYIATILDAEFGALNDVPFSVSRRFTGKGVAPVNGNGAHGATDPRDRLIELLLVSALQPNRAPAPAAVDPLAIVREIAGIYRAMPAPATAQPPADSNAVLHAFQTAFGMAQEMAATAEGGVAGVLASHAPRILELFGMALQQRRVPSPAAPVTMTTHAAPPPTTLEPAHVVGSIDPAWLQAFAPWKGMLLSAADDGAEPQGAADSILDVVARKSETDFQLFAAGVLADTAEADVFRFIPDAKANPQRGQFVRELIGALRTGLEQMANEQEGSANG